MKERILENKKDYYDEEKDIQTVERYYSDIDFNGNEVIQLLEELLEETHTNQVSYKPTEYVYPWVDLRPDGNLKSIYSGKSRKAEGVIKEDYAASLNRKDMIDRLEQNEGFDQLLKIKNDFPYNCEHVVPQSWFNERKPMRGDIH